ncbi:recombinase family protein [Prauserella muralis]|uniref:recombinase family protein n=1 Tax=Prauserella muralis TaxID=588067 RepID=UPI000DD30344|nr:recombinase family protein [Prauserella muralis]TWE27582.1 recombinase [Prauserella muralis]
MSARHRDRPRWRRALRCRRRLEAPARPTPPRPGDVSDSLRARVIDDYHAMTSRWARERIIKLVRAGYHLGTVPYGYRAMRAIPAGSIRTLPRLVPDPATAPVVPLIYCWRLDERLSLTGIADRLNADPTRYPRPVHAATGHPRPWTPKIVRNILTNPVYIGRTVWGRTRAGRPVPAQQWIISGPRAHRALVDDRAFEHAAATLAKPRGRRSAGAGGVTFPKTAIRRCTSPGCS